MIFVHCGSVSAFEARGPGWSSQQWGNDSGFTIFYKLFYDFKKLQFKYKKKKKKKLKFYFLVNTEKKRLQV